jgi:hypothetical protein
MNSTAFTRNIKLQALQPAQVPRVAVERHALITRFGDTIDVRNRGTLKVSRFAGSHAETQDAPAVVRIWTDDQCREITSHQARALAAQLLAAATLADAQNNH